jgi:hypothetical protein
MKFNEYFLIINLFLFALSGCTFSDVEEFNGAISGIIYDSNQSIVPGDVMSNTLVVKVQGESDLTPITIRVKGDGKFQNTNLYPKKYKVWLEGSIVPMDPLELDLSGNQHSITNIVVTPYLSISNSIIDNPTSNSVKIRYLIVPNTGSVPVKREIYCSTLTYPTANSGSGPFYSTKKATITNNSGEITITGLNANTKYYIRTGANISGKSMNYAPQIELTTAKN